MIGRVYRGVKVAGLVRYLYGPGRHNEHVDQRLVACWSGTEAPVLAVVEPEWTGGQVGVGERDYRGLVAELEAPAAYAGRMDPDPVWHCPLRTAPGDRVLSDAEWAQVAVDLMHRTGIAPRGDDGGCRWVAMRHDEVSIHVVAVLARQDGGRAHVFRDYPQVRATCLAAEARYGLVVTAPADRTAATHTTRAEVEKAARAGRVPARDWLRTEVQHAAAASREPIEFLDRLRAVGVAVRERHDPQGRLTGYAVGRVEQPGAEPVLFGGGRLAADLSLPKLQARWAGAGATQGQQSTLSTAGGGQADDGVRAQLWERATAAAGVAAEAVLAQHGSDPAAAGDAAAAAAEVLAAAGRLIEGPAGGRLTAAARDYDRAARERYGQLPAATDAGRLLRAAALQLARAGRRPGRGGARRAADHPGQSAVPGGGSVAGGAGPHRTGRGGAAGNADDAHCSGALGQRDSAVPCCPAAQRSRDDGARSATGRCDHAELDYGRPAAGSRSTTWESSPQSVTGCGHRDRAPILPAVHGHRVRGRLGAGPPPLHFGGGCSPRRAGPAG